MDRLEEGRARQLARYWRGEAETKGWVCIASCAGAGLASGLLLPTAGLLYVVERWREVGVELPMGTTTVEGGISRHPLGVVLPETEGCERRKLQFSSSSGELDT